MSKTPSYSKEEVFVIVYKLKFNLEHKLNFEYIPLRKNMEEAEKKGDFTAYFVLESKMAQLQKEIEKEYDDLLLARNTYKEMSSPKRQGN